MMKTIISGLLLGALHGAMVPAIANESKLTKGFYTMDAMGCMLLQECTDDVQEIKTIEDIRDVYPDSNYDPVATEFDSILQSFNKVGVGVFLADEKYFPVGHRGVYHTVGNNFFLNKSFMHRPHVLMSVVRHEGWHAAQDCMAGTIENNLIAIIHNEEDVPKIWQEIASHTYASMPHAIPWEKEATWAGKTAGMTENALQACAEGEMWKVYEPTPLTAQWLRENNYID
jgi:hypothetical protein|tara:strand:+ start:279 stop:962 length:684 start_codon:yes stop_codon:yes gene_type:complete